MDSANRVFPSGWSASSNLSACPARRSRMARPRPLTTAATRPSSSMRMCSGRFAPTAPKDRIVSGGARYTGTLARASERAARTCSGRSASTATAAIANPGRAFSRSQTSSSSARSARPDRVPADQNETQTTFPRRPIRTIGSAVSGSRIRSGGGFAPTFGGPAGGVGPYLNQAVPTSARTVTRTMRAPTGSIRRGGLVPVTSRAPCCRDRVSWASGR